MKATVRVLDEINVQIQGLDLDTRNEIVEATGIFRPESRHTAAFKLKHWDGIESNFQQNGRTYYYMLPIVLPMVERRGYELELVDHRKGFPFQVNRSPITENFLKDRGMEWRYYQLDSINAVVAHHKGFLDLATSAGKTYVCAGICAYYEPHKSLIIVPSEYLVNQTFDVLSLAVDDCAKITSKVQGKKRKSAWDADHLVITWQTLKNNKELVRDRHIVMYDEAHIMGDTMYDLFENYLTDSFVRIGLTGSMPNKDKFISTVDIEMLAIRHNIKLPLDPETGKINWEDEQHYLNTNKKRINKVAEVADIFYSAFPGNYLILTHPEVGRHMAQVMGLDFIDKDVDTTVREEFFTKFDTDPNYRLVASYGTSGTGISVDNIQYVMLVDAGENDTRIKQGIGRGLRKDGKQNHLKVFDVYTKLVLPTDNEDSGMVYNFGGTKHLTGRKRIYKKLHYPFSELPDIEVDE